MENKDAIDDEEIKEEQNINREGEMKALSEKAQQLLQQLEKYKIIGGINSEQRFEISEIWH